jgi:hypothetical protein
MAGYVLFIIVALPIQLQRSHEVQDTLSRLSAGCNQI